MRLPAWCCSSVTSARAARVAELSAAIRAAAPRPVLICVDQEGGRVQRFREGFSALAPLQSFGAQYAQAPEAALAAARAHAQLMASEVRASGVDLSFAPVVDLGRGNRAIGDRAFSDDPQIVATFTRAYVQALHGAGMAATLKHFSRPRHRAGRHPCRPCQRPAAAGGVAGRRSGAVRGRHRGRRRRGDDGARGLPPGGPGTGWVFAALDRTDPARPDGLPRRGLFPTISAWPPR